MFSAWGARSGQIPDLEGGASEDVCDWVNEKEFVFLAPQNTQAALIDGITVHSFANLGIKGDGRAAPSKFGPDKFTKYQRIRWVVVDETSTVPLEVLVALEKQMTVAARDKRTWKLRRPQEPRMFGGCNLVLAGDFWQFPAVRATSVFHNPWAKTRSFGVAAMQRFLWTHSVENMAQLFELTKEQRCMDPWLSVVLQEARHGRQSQEVWSFLHGYPTLHAGSWNPSTGKCTCQRAECEALYQKWAVEAQNRVMRPWALRQQEECVQCQTERRRRCIVAGTSLLSPNPKDMKFLAGPFIHALNAAKYIAAQLRAKFVARHRKHLLLWVVAQDMPLFTGEHGDPTASTAGKESWLRRHDQDTGGIMGLLPLLPGMPVRVTQTLPELRRFKIYKNTRATLLGWSLDEHDLERIRDSTGMELVLEKMPACLFLKIEGATWQEELDAEVGVIRVRPILQHWKVDPQGLATIARRGFPIACDYAGTAHSFMGSTLKACTLDLEAWNAPSNRDAQLSGYMCLSRVKKCEDVCVTQAFSPNLFAQGDLLGPRLLLDVHRQATDLAEAKKKLRYGETKAAANEGHTVGLSLMHPQ